MKLLETDHPFFRPLWIRVVITAFAAAWTVFEFMHGSEIWGMIVLCFTGLSVWGFFVDFNPDGKSPKAPPGDDDRP